MRLKGHVAIVTGGGSGIGAATASALAAEGCRVVVAGRRQTALDQTAQAAADKITPVVADVTDRAAVDALVAATIQTSGRVDALVNCAGTNTVRRSTSEVSAEEWERLVKVNATGAFHCIQSVLPQMRKQSRGTIVNVSSVAGRRATPLGGVAYNASKFAMTALGITVGDEEREHGIRVTNVLPGEVNTPILDARPVPLTAEHRARILQPEDVAATVVFLCCLPPRVRIPELVIVPTSQSFV